jgi:hypothetical protein
MEFIFKPDYRVYTQMPGKVARPFQQKIIKHSPDGFAWGYGGSGPADLALNILFELTDFSTAEKLYQEFKREKIARIPYSGGKLTLEEIRDWLAERGKSCSNSLRVL